MKLRCAIPWDCPTTVGVALIAMPSHLEGLLFVLGQVALSSHCSTDWRRIPCNSCNEVTYLAGMSLDTASCQAGWYSCTVSAHPQPP